MVFIENEKLDFDVQSCITVHFTTLEIRVEQRIFFLIFPTFRDVLASLELYVKKKMQL